MAGRRGDSTTAPVAAPACESFRANVLIRSGSANTDACGVGTPCSRVSGTNNLKIKYPHVVSFCGGSITLLI